MHCRPTVSRRQKKLWDPSDDEKWQHDKFEMLSRPREEDDYMVTLLSAA